MARVVLALTLVLCVTARKNDSVKLATSTRQSDIHSLGRRSCELVNSIRAQYGLRRLWYSGSLTDRSYAHSTWMYQYNAFQHQNLGSVWFYVWDAKYGAQRLMTASGENIATSAHRSSDVALDFHWQWVNSPPHFQNMLGGGHSHCGAGFAYDPRTGIWWATQLFGTGQFGAEMGGVTPA